MPGLIEVEQLWRSYSMGENIVHALRGITLSIARSEFVAIMGPSGSGKSTFMNVIGCLDQPTSGRYLLDGTDVGRLSRDERAEIRNRKIGFVFQSYQLLARTSAIENVELPLLYSDVPSHLYREKALRALHVVGMKGREDHHPNQLSGGQQQRTAIARALVNDPEIILADEPTGALDSRTGAEIMTIFQELNRQRGISIILVTHEPDIAQYAQRIVQFRDGVVVRDAPVRHRRDVAEELAIAALERIPA